jgi:hypothetical protein
MLARRQPIFFAALSWMPAISGVSITWTGVSRIGARKSAHSR